ncbi:class I SAM-dependent methyltransferase [Nostoc sp.]|uniref:class I SAM-dependent methyltransferase n=1 Tax=Nostoc sp. TaxID=1180 RepID=UPI002FF5762F
MNQQFQHPMLPQPTHDELARQNFVQTMKMHIFKNVTPGNKEIYEKLAKPKFEQEHQRPPENRYEIREVMQHEPYYRWTSALKRINQEMLWDAVNANVDRQLPELIERAKDKGSELGTLTLDPNFQIPAYQKAVDIHCMPGGYHSEFTADDVAAGATYDRGAYVYGLGWLGPLNDDMGLSIVQNYLLAEFPNFQPSKILDMGCSIGNSTLPYIDGFPDAEVHAIDIGASILRYAHARAEALGKRVHFSQQNAEHTNFPDESFDLVVSHILLHEIPPSSVRKVMQESYRLLAPGGMMIHLEAPLYHHMDLYTQFIYDWETANNNEPFWSAVRDLDLVPLVTEAGFAADKTFEKFVPNGAWKAKEPNGMFQNRNSATQGTWFMVVATK